MKIKKGLITLSAMTALLTIAGCGKRSSNNNQSSSSSQSSKINTSSASTSSTATQQKAPVSNQTIGVLAELLINPNDFKSDVQAGNLYYDEQLSSSDNETKGFSYFNVDKDKSNYFYYQFNNGKVIIKQPKSDSNSYKTTTISLKQLLKDYYVNDAQKQEVQGYVNQLKPESEYKPVTNRWIVPVGYRGTWYKYDESSRKQDILEVTASTAQLTQNGQKYGLITVHSGSDSGNLGTYFQFGSGEGYTDGFAIWTKKMNINGQMQTVLKTYERMGDYFVYTKQPVDQDHSYTDREVKDAQLGN